MDQDTNKPCEVCGEQIKIEARKCVHCDSFLDWKRYLNLSSSIVSLLITLVSVIALSSQHIKEVFDKGHSNVRLALINSAEGKISLLAANDGNRAGAIFPAELDVYDSRYGNIQYIMVPKDKSFIVESGKAKQIDLEFEEKNAVAQHREWTEKGIRENQIDVKRKFETDCTLRISISQFDEFLDFFDAQERKIKRDAQYARRKDIPKNRPIEPPQREHVELSYIRCEEIFPWLEEQQPFAVNEEE